MLSATERGDIDVFDGDGLVTVLHRYELVLLLSFSLFTWLDRTSNSAMEVPTYIPLLC